MSDEYDFLAATDRNYEQTVKLRAALNALGEEYVRYQRTHGEPIEEWPRWPVWFKDYQKQLQIVLRFEEMIRRKAAAILVEKQRRHNYEMRSVLPEVPVPDRS